MTKEEALQFLREKGDPEVAEAKAKKFGIPVEEGMLGVYQKETNELVKILKKDSLLAQELYDTGIYEAQMVAAKIWKPKDVSFEMADYWVKAFTNWEICDTFSMKLFARTTWAVKGVNEWSLQEAEFVKRSAFATLAGYSLANKDASNDHFEQFYPLIRAAANDNRNFVKKAVSWALRSIGKRNIDLQKSAIICAEDVLLGGSKAELWIAKDVLKELTGDNVRISNYPRGVYA